MSEYQHSITVQAPLEQVFAFVSDVRNLHQYLPTVHQAETQGAERVRVQGEAAGHAYDSDGYFRVDKNQHRMEWGSDGENRYAGWLEVENAGRTGSGTEVTVHLSFEPRPDQEEAFKQQMGSRDAVIREGLEKALLSIQNILEGKGSKVESQAAR